MICFRVGFGEIIFPIRIELTVERAESKKSGIFGICEHAHQSDLAKKAKADLNSRASNVFAEKSF